jgi:hypothetical protein
MKRGDLCYPTVSKAAVQLALPALRWLTLACGGTSSNRAGDAGDASPSSKQKGLECEE